MWMRFLAFRMSHELRPGRATRGKWRITDGKVGEWIIFMFGDPKVVAGPMSIKDRVGWALRNKHRLCTGACGIYGVL
jgi:hypothetical protein